MLGFAGAHRTGKSTLAKEFAERYDLDYLETSVSSVFEELGLDPAVTYDFATRLRVQRAILKHLDRLYSAIDPEDLDATVVDRTPLDLLMYTYAEVLPGLLSPQELDDLMLYTAECFALLNRRFRLITIVQPAIKVVPAPGKAALDLAYMEHLNTLCMGFMNDERMKTKVAYIPRHMVDLDKRINAVLDVLERFCTQAERMTIKRLERGVHLH